MTDPHALLVTPSGPVKAEAFERGLAALADLDIPARWPDSALSAHAEADYLAGGDADRARELVAAVRERPRAVWMIRGGYGAIRTLEALTASGEDLFSGDPVPLWGFSDGTALLAAWDRAGWPAWQAPPITQLPRLSPESLARLRAAWHAGHLAPYPDLETIVPGAARGPLAGGNLCVLASLVGTPFEADLSGRVVLVEDVGERGYKVDRLFTQLRLSGALARAAALVIGDFTAIPANQRAIIFRFFDAEAPRLGIPVVKGMPIGHQHDNAPLPFGPGSGWDAVLEAPADGPATLSFAPRP